MIISKLEIENFKTVEDKKTIIFHNGINVIIGTNGVGKSNILDSIAFVFGKKDKRVKNNKSFFNKNNNSGKTVVKITTNDDQTFTRILKQYSSGYTKSKYYINGKLSAKKQITDYIEQINTELIDNYGICMDIKRSTDYAQNLKKKANNTQIIIVNHLKTIIAVADKIHKIV